MAKFKALISFGGIKIRARKGEILEIDDQELSDDLAQAGYVEAVAMNPAEKKEEKKEEAPEMEEKPAPKKAGRKPKKEAES